MKKNAYAVIVCNGNLPGKKRIQELLLHASLIVCADGGTNHIVRLDIIPHVVIGDMDSLPSSIRKKLASYPVIWKTYPKDKNEIDAELALQYATTQGYKKIFVCGAYGSRIDHTLANILLLTTAPSSVSTTIIHGSQDIFLIRSHEVIDGQHGDTLSLLPLKGDVSGITTKGLQFPLTKVALRFGFTQGVSNVFISSFATITIQSGLLLGIHTHKNL